MDFDNQILTSRIRDLAKSKNIKLKDMLDHCNLGRNAMSHLDNGRSIAHDSLIRIANYLDVTDLSYTIYIDNTYYTQETDWPIFNYNGVTYMPLTTNTANTLNLWLTWDATNGIGINTYEK